MSARRRRISRYRRCSSSIGRLLGIDLPWLENVTRARRPKRLPVVLTVAGVRSVLAQLDGTPWLVANILYGSGLRLMEALRLRVKDVVIERQELIVRDAKGSKDRVTILPSSILDALRAHLSKLHLRFNQQRKAGEAGVSLPSALARKFPNYAKQWGWQYLFTADSRSVKTPIPVNQVRHHVHERSIQRTVQFAVQKAAVSRSLRAVIRFRHSFRDAPSGGGLRHSRTIQGVAGALRTSE